MPGHAYQENHLCFHQKQLGHDVWVITSDRPASKFRSSQEDGYAPGIYKDRDVPIIRLPCLVEIKQHGQVMLRGLIGQVINLKPDVIHSHGIWSFHTQQIMYSIVPKVCKLFVDDHADGRNIRLDLPSRRFWIWFFKRTLLPTMKHKVSRFIAVNPFSQWHLRHNLGIPENRIAFLPLGVNDDSYYPDPRRRKQIRAQLRILDDEVVFFTGAGFDSTKALDILIKAFAEVASQNSSVRLVVIGSGPREYVDTLKQLCRDLGLGERVIFTGWVEPAELPAYYNAGDVAVMPGKISTTKDSLGVGVPLIVSREKASEYLIAHGNGMAFEPGDIHGLATIMRSYAESLLLRAQHGIKSLELVRTSLSWRRIAERSIAIYTGVD